MLFTIDCINIKKSKKVLLTNEAEFPILVRIIENNSYTVIPSFSLLKSKERKNFQILHRLNTKPDSLIKIEAIEFDETKLDTFSVPPFWNERVKGSLKTLSQSLHLSESSSFVSYDRPPAMNQTFQDQNQVQNNTNVCQNKFHTKWLKQNSSIHDNQSDQFNSKQHINSQQSIQVIGSTKIAEENKFHQSYQQERKHSISSFESYGYISTTQTQQQILKMPKDLNNFLDQIDSSNSPFQIQTPSQQQSQTHSYINIPDNAQQDVSISETTSIQRFGYRKLSFLQQSRLQFNEKPKLRVSQSFINHPRFTIQNQQILSKFKELENQLQKQITGLQINKGVLQQELKKLEFKVMFNNKNGNSYDQQHYFIWHILIASVLCLILGSFLKKIIPQF
ncbi:unnamed protein product (macronuclear) [Paramecium tetraurelia]|uniref:MSP domain-containing protein n=1 Tax=Paramecium tetraurelia TaxID=5888 RepID=A0D6U5_PARTE|nr:uncharacterized protein GSPATT00001803001 [Paramecium tetraurelia]CAK78762.1 unnamed protein product [Paramecium tetraurelia]|eukprot:XP_001446159.1 hypothetical protein (macronuclear) [Paramecium tetraurelia strain d4-2]